MRWSPPVELSAWEKKLCSKLKRAGRFYAFLRQVRLTLFDEVLQADLMGMYTGAHRGTEPARAGQVAMLLLLQGYAKVSDAEAIRRAQMDDAWKMVLDTLGDEESPASKSTLQNVRNRLIETGMDQVLLAKTVALARATGLFGVSALKGLRVAVDSAPLEGAGRVEDTINLIGHALRNLVRTIAHAQGREDVIALAREAGAPVAIATSTKAGLDLDWDAEDAQQRALDALLAQAASVRAYLVRQPDGVRYAGTVREALDLLARIVAQDTEPSPSGAPPGTPSPSPPPLPPSGAATPSQADADAPGMKVSFVPASSTRSSSFTSSRPPASGLRIAQGVAHDRLISISDPEMRHGRKSASQRINGYKRYIARNLDDGGLILAVAVKSANVPEYQGADAMRAELATHGVLRELHVDRAFLPGKLVHQLDDAGGDVVARPYAERAGPGYSKRAFNIDLDQQTVTCPAGKVAPINGLTARFQLNDCTSCPQRAQCMKPGTRRRRVIALHQREALLQKLVRRTATPEGRATLRPRTAIEHALAHVTFRQGARARYFGRRKSEYDLRRSAAIFNLQAIDRAAQLLDGGQA
jgi:hypothetical protein